MVDLIAFDQKKCCLWVLLSFLLGPVHGKRFQLGLKLKKKHIKLVKFLIL